MFSSMRSLQLRQCQYSRFLSQSQHVHVVWRLSKAQLVSERCDFQVTFQGHVAVATPTSYPSLLEHGRLDGIGP